MCQWDMINHLAGCLFMSIAERVLQVQQQIRDRAQGRSVTLVAVSKGQKPSALNAAYDAGVRAFGESYVQEALLKLAALGHLPIEWHFIGPLQGNKTGAIARHFSWVHGLERERIARRLSESRLEAGLAPLQVCVQVNLSQEPSKSGVALQALEALVHEVALLPGLRLRGLMTLPEPTSSTALQRQRFAALRQEQERLIRLGYDLDTLSMGMSGDYIAALAEGSTIVRIGTAIFGERNNT